MQLLLINKNNQVLDLLNSRDKFVKSADDGLHGVETEIAETESAYMDGAHLESVRALPRGIEIVLTLKGNVKDSIDYITSFVKSKQYVTLREIDDKRDIAIKGIVTIPPYTRMLQTCKITLSIYCGQPYWEDVQYVVDTIAHIIDLLYFPEEGQYFPEEGRPFGAYDLDLTKTFTNAGDVSVGARFEIIALKKITFPRISCSTGEQNGWYMQLNVELEANDELVINTQRGEKFITINGETTYKGTPLLNAFEFVGNDWLQLELGENTFNITANYGADGAYFTLVYKARYE